MFVVRNITNAAVSSQRLLTKRNAAIERIFPKRKITVVFLLPIFARIDDSDDSTTSVIRELAAYMSPMYFSEMNVLRNVEFTYAVNAR